MLHTLFFDSPDGDLFRLHGTLPDKLGADVGLSSLKHLSLVNQRLSGTMPAAFYSQLNCTEEYVTPSSPACDFWLEGNELVGRVPRTACSQQFNELYLGNTTLGCESMPCIRAAYYSVPENCSKQNCVKC